MIQTYQAPCGKVTAPLLNDKVAVTGHFGRKTGFSPTNQPQMPLFQDLLRDPWCEESHGKMKNWIVLQGLQSHPSAFGTTANHSENHKTAPGAASLTHVRAYAHTRARVEGCGACIHTVWSCCWVCAAWVFFACFKVLMLLRALLHPDGFPLLSYSVAVHVHVHVSVTGGTDFCFQISHHFHTAAQGSWGKGTIAFF